MARYPVRMGSIEDYQRQVAALVLRAEAATTLEHRACLLTTAAGWRDLILHTAMMERFQASGAFKDLTSDTLPAPLG
jgi:hypothetical protein